MRKVASEYRFYPDGKFEEYKYPYTSNDRIGAGSTFLWKIEGRTLVLVDEIYSFNLTKDKLTLYWQNALSSEKWNKMILVPVPKE